MKVKVSELTEGTINGIKKQTATKIKNWVLKNPHKTIFHLQDALRLSNQFIRNNTICMKCGHVEVKATYAIAQRAMGHSVTFTCECGSKFQV